MEIIGYSERGIVNSLIFEMVRNLNSTALLNEFVSMICFPNDDVRILVDDVKILIEQSFSDFGDADAVLLINDGGLKKSVFIEAKVKTFSKKTWTIAEEFEKFQIGVNEVNLNPSNLFTQLYRKVRLMDCLRVGGFEVLNDGAEFPNCDKKKVRKIGSNGVVLKAVEMLDEYRDGSYFVGFLPDTPNNLKDFFSNRLHDFPLVDFRGWDTKNWGYLAWEDIHRFCRDKNMSATLKVFEHNRGQIF